MPGLGIGGGPECPSSGGGIGAGPGVGGTIGGSGVGGTIGGSGIGGGGIGATTGGSSAGTAMGGSPGGAIGGWLFLQPMSAAPPSVTISAPIAGRTSAGTEGGDVGRSFSREPTPYCRGHGLALSNATLARSSMRVAKRWFMPPNALPRPF